MENLEVVIKSNTGTDDVKLTKETVKEYLVRGDKSLITDQEVYLFMELCKHQNLNPFISDAYLVKYSQRETASMVVGISVFTKRAYDNQDCNGWKSGIVAFNKETKELTERIGTVYTPEEILVGGWCEVFFKSKEYPIKQTVLLKEYIQTKADGTPNKFWKSKPGTMIQKVAEMQALRKAFPKDLQGLYAAEELGLVDDVEHIKKIMDFDEACETGPETPKPSATPNF